MFKVVIWILTVSFLIFLIEKRTERSVVKMSDYFFIFFWNFSNLNSILWALWDICNMLNILIEGSFWILLTLLKIFEAI